MISKIKHHAEEILRILDEEDAERIEDEAPVEPIPEPTPEPVEEVLSTPISNFKAEIIAKDIVQLSWDDGKGEFDIEFYRPSVDKKWKHSVYKYLKVLVDAESGAYNIGLGDPVFGALFRVKQGDWISKPVVATYPKTEPIVETEPVKEEPIAEPIKEEPVVEDEVIEPVIEQPTKPVQIALAFHNNYNVDIWLNGELIPKERPFDYSFSNPVGAAIRVKLAWIDDLKTFMIEPTQINHDTFAYKLINRDRDSDLSKINANHIGDVGSGDPDFWGEPAKTNPLGIIVSRRGDTRYDTRFPYPLFYKGFPDDPINHPNDLTIHPQWSTNKKIVLNLGI